MPDALVSNAWHLPRATANFKAAGLAVVPAPMGFSISTNDFIAFLPSASALSVSSRALHEW
ncbi:MAG: YdcF family protein, partial [Betaproteobacteria bacterium]|nr:YdcF family protein [Betaproteobacteria bacterium]